MNTDASKEKTRLGDIQNQEQTKSKTKSNIQSNINKISIKKKSNMNKFRARPKPFQRIRKKHLNLTPLGTSKSRLIRSHSTSSIPTSTSTSNSKQSLQNRIPPKTKQMSKLNRNLNFGFKKSRHLPMERTTYTNSNNNKRYSHKQFPPMKHDIRMRAGKRIRLMASAAGPQSRYNKKKETESNSNHLPTQSPHSTHSTQSRGSHSSHTSHASEKHNDRTDHTKTNGVKLQNSNQRSTSNPTVKSSIVSKPVAKSPKSPRSPRTNKPDTQPKNVQKLANGNTKIKSYNREVLQCLEAGARIKIVTKQGQVIKGEVFCSIPQIPPICVMHHYNSHPQGTKHVFVICIDEIASCEKFTQIETRDALQLTSIDENEMQTRLAENLKQRCEMMKTLNPDVCDTIQEFFDFLHRTTPEGCAWGNNNSIVFDEFGLEICPPFYRNLTLVKPRSWRDANRNQNMNKSRNRHNAKLGGVGISENLSNSVQRSWIEQRIKQFWGENGKHASLLKYLSSQNRDSTPRSKLEEQSVLGFPNSAGSLISAQCENVNIIRNNTIANANASVNLQPYLVPPAYPQLMTNTTSKLEMNSNVIDDSNNNNTVSVQVSHGRGKPRGRGEYGVGSHIPPRLQRTSAHRNRGRSRGIGRSNGRGNTQNNNVKVRAKGRGVSNISHVNSTNISENPFTAEHQ